MKYFEPEAAGWWGKGTATLDWCEENYVVSPYVAEWWNTLSNLAFVFYSLDGMRNCMREGLEKRIMANHLAVLTVGLGSALFHGSLLYENQLADELPMIYGTCVMVFTVYEDEKHRKYGLGLPFALLLYSVGVTAIYCTIHQPVFHQTAYALLVLSMVIKLVSLCRQPALRQFSPLLYAGAITYLAGFVVWNVDNLHCDWVREARNVLPPALKPLLQLHAWWHFLTATGTHLMVVALTCIRAVTLGYNDTKVVWRYGLLPYVVPHTTAYTSGKSSNGIFKAPAAMDGSNGVTTGKKGD